MECTFYNVVGTFANGRVWQERHTTYKPKAIDAYHDMILRAEELVDQGNLAYKGVKVSLVETEVDYDSPYIWAVIG